MKTSMTIAKKKKSRVLNATLPYPLLARMERFCDSRSMPKSRLVSVSVAFFLDSMDRTDVIHDRGKFWKAAPMPPDEIEEGKVIPFPSATPI